MQTEKACEEKLIVAHVVLVDCRPRNRDGLLLFLLPIWHRLNVE